MRICVKRLVGGAQQFFDVDDDATVAELISAISRVAFSRTAICLYLDGEELSQAERLADCGVRSGTRILMAELQDTLAAQSPPPISTCNALFQPHIRQFYSEDRDTVLRAVKRVRELIRTHNGGRAAVSEGHGLDHVFRILVTSKDDELIRAALKVLLSAAVSDTVERVIFAKGGVEQAMLHGRATTSMDTRRAAVTLFFNLCFNEETRTRIVETGGLDFIADMITSPGGCEGDSETKPVALQASKALLLLLQDKSPPESGVELRRRVLAHDSLVKALCVTMVLCEDPRIQDRAAKLLRVLLTDADVCARGVANPVVCSSLERLCAHHHRYAREAVLHLRTTLPEDSIPPMLLAIRTTSNMSSEERRQERRTMRLVRPAGAGAAGSQPTASIGPPTAIPAQASSGASVPSFVVFPVEPGAERS